METLKEAIDYLKIHGKDIGQKAKEGNQLCKNIVSLYSMIYKAPCNGSIAFLCASIEEYRKVKYIL